MKYFFIGLFTFFITSQQQQISCIEKITFKRTSEGPSPDLISLKVKLSEADIKLLSKKVFSKLYFEIDSNSKSR